MSELIIVGDRVLIKPQEGEERTESGLVLPESAVAQEDVGSGRIVQVGPGHLMPNPEYSEGESWKPSGEAVRYLPLQAEPGDAAFFLRERAVPLTYEGTDYRIVPHAAILALVRPET